MPRQRIDKLGSVGLNTDVMPYMLPPQAWTRMLNVSTQDGDLRSVVGERKLFDISIRPRYHTSYITPQGVQLVVVSDGVSVKTYTMDGVEEDITPETPFSGGYVSFTNLNSVLVVNSEPDGPFYWAGTGTVLKTLADFGWDASWRCRQMVAFRYYLVALGVNEGTSEYPYKVRWSSAAPEGALPTEWVATPANDAGADLIGETSGHIIGGVLVRDALWIVKVDAIYEMRWIGGDYIMQLSRLKENIGTRLQDGFAPMLGGLAIFTTSDLLFFDGMNSKSLVDQRVRNGIFSQISEEKWDRSLLFVHPESSTLLVAGVEAGFSNLTAALVLNLEEDTWSHRKLTFGYGFDAVYASLTTGQPTWDDLVPGVTMGLGVTPQWVVGGTWDSQNISPWNKGVFLPSMTDVLVYEGNAEDTAWSAALMALVNTNSDGSAKSCMAERIAIPIEGADGVSMITEVWPEIRGSAPLNFSIGGQMAANGEVFWDGPYTVQAGITESFTPRVSGRYIALRIESNTNGCWCLGSLTVNWERVGER